MLKSKHCFEYAYVAVYLILFIEINYLTIASHNINNMAVCFVCSCAGHVIVTNKGKVPVDYECTQKIGKVMIKACTTVKTWKGV